MHGEKRKRDKKDKKKHDKKSNKKDKKDRRRTLRPSERFVRAAFGLATAGDGINPRKNTHTGRCLV